MLDETKLFDFVKIMFSKQQQYPNVKNINKQRHRFMVNRLFAIKYPTAAQLLNRNGVSGMAVADSWFRVSSQFKQVPNWIWTKTKKEAAIKAESKYEPSDAVISLFLERNEIGVREYKELLKFQPTQTLQHLKNLEEKMQMY